MHSPDRWYWWDGTGWQRAVSPDGSQWFDGERWVPNPYGPLRYEKMPTRWTRPLQVVVAAMAALAVVLFLTSLPVLGAALTSSPVPVPPGTPTQQAAQAEQSFRFFSVVSFGVFAAVYVALLVLVGLGAVKRWDWMFWVTVGLSGLVSVSLVPAVLIGVFGITTPGPPPSQPVSRPGIALQAVGLMESLAIAALFVWMLVLGIRIGPWACRRQVPLGGFQGPTP